MERVLKTQENLMDQMFEETQKRITERVADGTSRLKVAGGWIYRVPRIPRG